MMHRRYIDDTYIYLPHISRFPTVHLFWGCHRKNATWPWCGSHRLFVGVSGAAGLGKSWLLGSWAMGNCDWIVTVYRWKYHLVMTNSLPWKDPPFLIGKPSINGYVSHNQRVLPIRSNRRCRDMFVVLPSRFRKNLVENLQSNRQSNLASQWNWSSTGLNFFQRNIWMAYGWHVCRTYPVLVRYGGHDFMANLLLGWREWGSAGVVQISPENQSFCSKSSRFLWHMPWKNINY